LSPISAALSRRFILLLNGWGVLLYVASGSPRITYCSSIALITANPLYSASSQPFLLLFFLSGADVADDLDDAMSLTISQLTIVLLLFLSILLSPTIRAQQLSPTYPLAVRSPYLNCWLQFNNTFSVGFGHTWPTTFNHSQVCHPHMFYWL
jgi:hypothetical protein